MEIGVDAVPAGLFRRAAPWGKGGAALPRPDIAAGIGGGQRLILPPSCAVAQKNRSLLFMRSCQEDSIKKKGAPVFYLKGTIFYLMLSLCGKITLDKHAYMRVTPSNEP